MSNDLSKVLGEWQFRPDEVLVRIVPGDDGRGKVQLRVDLGILQMEMDGRPDGHRPEGFESWLDYYEYLQQAHDETHPDSAAFPVERGGLPAAVARGGSVLPSLLEFLALGTV